MKKNSFLILSLSLGLNLTYSQTEKNISTKKVKAPKVEKSDKADQVITNRRFRAQNGSLSKFSMNSNLNYDGGSLENPLAADRPNLSNAGDTTSIAGLRGTITGSYRINSLNRVNIGTGLQMLAPFNDSIDTDDPRAEREFDENRGDLDISNPVASYTHMNNFFGVQTILSAGVRQYTASNLTDVGYQNDVNASINTMYNVGKTGFSFGALVVYNKYFFNKDDEEYQSVQNDVVWGVLPQAEYIINDTFNLRTIVRSNWYQNTVADSEFEQRPVTQSVGLGISINRDVFLYPNLQFVYRNLQAENTNIGISANINMF